jgi:hypothetical protein
LKNDVYDGKSFAFTIKNKGYVGLVGFYGEDFRQYDITDGTWSYKEVKGDIYNRAAFSIGNFGYAVGGTRFNGDETFAKADVDQYNPTTDSWTPKASLPIDFTNTVGFSIDGKGYAG